MAMSKMDLITFLTRSLIELPNYKFIKPCFPHLHEDKF